MTEPNTLPELGGKGAGVYGLSSDHFTSDTLDEQIDYLLVSLYVGETFMQDNPNWREQMDNPKLQATANKLKTLFTEHSKEVDRLARIDELKKLDVFTDSGNCVMGMDEAEYRNRLTQLSKRNK